MNVITRPQPKTKISASEMERRRKFVVSAAASTRMEGGKRDPKAAPIFDAYIAGEIEATDIVPRLNALYGL